MRPVSAHQIKTCWHAQILRTALQAPRPISSPENQGGKLRANQLNCANNSAVQLPDRIPAAILGHCRLIFWPIIPFALYITLLLVLTVVFNINPAWSFGIGIGILFAAHILARISASRICRAALDKQGHACLHCLSAIDVCRNDKPDDGGERIALAVVKDSRYGWRVWLICPRCQSRRTPVPSAGGLPVPEVRGNCEWGR